MGQDDVPIFSDLDETTLATDPSSVKRTESTAHSHQSDEHQKRKSRRNGSIRMSTTES